jgi:hypothetical protein
MEKREITKITGVNLRQEATDLAEAEAQKCVNFDISGKPGSIVIRKGKTILVDGTLTDLILRYLSKVNGFRYQIAGQKIYRDMVALTGNVLHEDMIQTSIVPMRALEDAYIWAFIADDAIMLKDNGTVLYIWGIDLVPTPDPQICNQTGKNPDDTITAGTYTGAVTQIRFVDPTVQGPDFVGEIEGAL